MAVISQHLIALQLVHPGASPTDKTGRFLPQHLPKRLSTRICYPVLQLKLQHFLQRSNIHVCAG